jgi:hypothetical protein
VASCVHDGYREVLSKFPDLKAPVVRIGQSTMQEQDRWAFAELRVENPCSVDRCVSAPRRTRQTGRLGAVLATSQVWRQPAFLASVLALYPGESPRPAPGMAGTKS